jgi:hypothetical protein
MVSIEIGIDYQQKVDVLNTLILNLNVSSLRLLNKYKGYVDAQFEPDVNIKTFDHVLTVLMC